MSSQVEPSASPDHTLRESTIGSIPRDEKDTELPVTDSSTILTGRKLAIVFVAILLSVLLIALDQTILATALPRIASDFDAFSLQGWISSSFVLTQTVFLLFYGQVLRIFPSKWVLVSAVTVFEVGSLVCGLGQSAGMIIAGRVVTGVGAAGIYVSTLQITAQVTRLEDRPSLFALFGAVFGLSSVIGPLVGGALTDHVTWRWVFYINLPFGGVSLLGVIFLLKSSPPLGADLSKRSTRDLLRQALRFDYVGLILVAGSLTTLVLALQWGGNTKPWGDKAVIISFVFAAVLAVVFIAWEKYLNESAMVPTAIFKSPSIFAIQTYAFCNQFALLLYSFYIPIFYQAARAHSATKSGIDILPFMLGTIITIMTVGQLVGRFGYYWPFLLGGGIILAIGSGVLYTINTNTPSANVIGFQIIVGLGVGMGLQNTILASQVEFSDTPVLIGQANSMVTFAQLLGGTIGLGIAEPVLASQLTKGLLKYAPNAPAAIVKESPTAIYTALAKDQIPGVVLSYTSALRAVFILGVPAAGLALLATMFIHNLKIPKEGVVTDGGTEMDEKERAA
ncbi:ABC transporter [Mycena metata]|uniref:ABC transporter n=1 Tax=Mycena metata TaxID=1033252 RepID=A0AAD7DQP9_9AGAR|nr:ABC transporter [Mycena metata]